MGWIVDKMFFECHCNRWSVDALSITVLSPRTWAEEGWPDLMAISSRVTCGLLRIHIFTQHFSPVNFYNWPTKKTTAKLDWESDFTSDPLAGWSDSFCHLLLSSSGFLVFFFFFFFHFVLSFFFPLNVNMKIIGFLFIDNGLMAFGWFGS